MSIKSMLEYGTKALEIAWRYSPSVCGGYKNRRLFDQVDTYFMFIGHSRSGHSLIGSLLDAHPDVICGHELGVLKYVYAGYTGRQIYYLLLENSRRFTQDGRKYSGYSYRVPNQWQGKFRKLKVIGDKQAAGAVLRLKARPRLLERLQSTVGGPVKFIHVVRNPYDNISTMARKEGMDTRQAIGYYFSLCETVMDLKIRINPSDLFEIRHEALISNAKGGIRKMCEFLGVDAPDDYLEDCAGIVFSTPRKTRGQHPWKREEIDIVQKMMGPFPFLRGYGYEE